MLMLELLMVLALKIIFLSRHLILLQLNDWPCSRLSNQMQRIAIVWNRDWNLSSDLDLDFVIGYLSRQSSRKLIIITTWKDTSVYMAGFYTTVSYFWKLDLDSDFVKYVKALGPWTCEQGALVVKTPDYLDWRCSVGLPPSSKLDSQVLLTLNWSTTCHMVMALSIWSWLHLKWPWMFGH